MSKIIFLDFDGVINSHRTHYAFGSMPSNLEPESVKLFDHIALSLIRTLCRTQLAEIVVSSSWRIRFTASQMRLALDLPIIDCTDKNIGCRGEQIQRWLDRHPEVEEWVIIDDDSDMLEKQKDHFVQTTYADGFIREHFLRARDILSGDLGGMYRNALFWEEHEAHDEGE